ncbi:PAQR family membrane homeostasis protein TrhA [Marivirga arenosa]|uniref:Hemolysin III family protein n=1 Tax=Marivirga arenosa TaxID=3059076 RepID=A0AA51ZY28_9BACT|nr:MULTISPECIES: hemolysin III family protein [unclassified Marivirga]WKK83918.1 hemolysin III family protein [Marivirga sp. ABR2-2]WNB18842.1 hemolysin III family protein [Marivirga sp. BKB1-2]
MKRPQTLEEELANSLTHGFGILFSVVAISLLITFSVLEGSVLHIISSSFFGGAFLLMYTFSTIYHAIQHEKSKAILRIFDHISIYFLIAGTYTPFLILGVGGFTGWLMFGIVWGIALIGTIFKIFFTHRFPRLSLFLYLGMGWIAVFIAKPLFLELSTTVLSLLIGGGVSYTLGTIFYTNQKMRYAHAIWHVFVLIGTITHFIAVMYLL